MGGSVIGRSRVLVVSQRKEFPETRAGGWGSVVNFIDGVKLKEVPLLTSQCPISVHLTKGKFQSSFQ